MFHKSFHDVGNSDFKDAINIHENFKCQATSRLVNVILTLCLINSLICIQTELEPLKNIANFMLHKFFHDFGICDFHERKVTLMKTSNVNLIHFIQRHFNLLFENELL